MPQQALVIMRVRQIFVQLMGFSNPAILHNLLLPTVNKIFFFYLIKNNLH